MVWVWLHLPDGRADRPCNGEPGKPLSDIRLVRYLCAEPRGQPDGQQHVNAQQGRTSHHALANACIPVEKAYKASAIE